ncbi:MAG: hypothetical protein JW874_12345 [Spirochaetales bacterium]|nr:hypothetical protein [Spirochaetales bacterium]
MGNSQCRSRDLFPLSRFFRLTLLTDGKWGEMGTDPEYMNAIVNYQ